MDNSDKLFEKVRNASEREEEADFPSMEKVWSRVETKLDQKVLKKENNLWKKIAIAASFLLIITLAYQIFKPVEPINSPLNEVPVVEPSSETTDVIQNAQSETISPNANSPIDESAVETAKKTTTKVTAVPDTSAIPITETVVPVTIQKDETEEEHSRKSNTFRKGNVFEARGVRRDNVETRVSESKKETQTVAVKSPPLMVIDGKAVTSKDRSPQESYQEGLNNVDYDKKEDIVILEEPLYIINGSHYSEQELFGPNPTSPYHPLSQQDIESLSILQGEKAISAYGKKGEKGVVIITTKDGKPSKAVTRTDK